jgi:uncharacterized Rmd1/YagE family protein
MQGFSVNQPTLDSIYGEMADRAATRRMEVLEWIIIVVITISITISLLPSFPVIQR